ncbi:MAG: flavin reductase family protein [Bacteroidia bacterium]|nr:flavin reductase family protein [Bacteroidia bacterium]
MLTIDPSKTETPDLHQYMIGSVSPRPIAFVSTISPDGTPNLAPYSFFNAFSSNPPLLIFSSNRKVKGNTTKDTLKNVEETGECVINMVNYNMVYQMSLASVEYPYGVSEFEKAGLTPVESEVVKPFRVKESPVQMECKVREIIKLGAKGGAGNLIICEVVRIHIQEEILNEKGRIDPYKADLVARMGRHYYCRANGDAIFELPQPVNILGMGVSALPESIRMSQILTGNNLAQLASFVALPSESECETVKTDERVINALAGNQQEREKHLHQYAKELLDAGNTAKAWLVLMVQ